MPTERVFIEEQLYIRQKALGALSVGTRDETDCKLLSRDLDGVAPFLDPQKEIYRVQIRRAVQKLGLTEEEVKFRYEALAQQFSLKLA